MIVHTFCTVQEAAAALHISEEQVETLLQNGVLHEFREGPYRLLRAAEVNTLAAGPVPGPRAGAESDPFLDPPLPLSLPRCPAVTFPPRQRSTARPGNPERVRPQAASAENPACARVSRHCGSAGVYRYQQRKGVRQPDGPVHMQPQSLSLREWLWSGLTQDRPVAIAILFVLVLTILAALAAGVCFLAEGL